MLDPIEQVLLKEVEKIKARNKKVEADKAWETSVFRRLVISSLIYCTVLSMGFFFWHFNFILATFVPPLGYFLSTLTLPKIKDWWIKNKYTN